MFYLSQVRDLHLLLQLLSAPSQLQNIKQAVPYTFPLTARIRPTDTQYSQSLPGIRVHPAFSPHP